ncbi:MAG: hypothetical protein DHS20C16_01530 [Phycisphaerae bacterium]|nr:MAG: hypothetical protein DHS20C16_01530 [Phycisphaerae bacterium]
MKIAALCRAKNWKFKTFLEYRAPEPIYQYPPLAGTNYAGTSERSKKTLRRFEACRDPVMLIPQQNTSGIAISNGV